MDTVTVAVTLFLVMDPIGNIPIFLSLLREMPPRRRLWVIARELLFAYIVLVVFLFFGQSLLNLFGLESESIQIAAGIILFIIALRMIFPIKGGVMGEDVEGEPFFVPLAVPLVAGPSTLAILLLLVRSDPGRMMDWFVAMTCAWLVSTLILFLANSLYRLLGRRGLIALERLMGMLLVTMAVQMFLDGVRPMLSA